jgi:two-component system response regulator AtoC
MAQVLIIEDEVLLAKSLSRTLIGKGHDCVVVTTAEEGLRLLEKTPADVILLDLQLPGMSGLEAIGHIRRVDSDVVIIVATAYGTMASVVEAMRSGAADFLRKPFDTEEVALAVERAVANARLKQTVSYYHQREAEKTDEDRLICNSPKMKIVSSVVQRVVSMDLASPSDYPPILILGETGTGKDLIARIIHFGSKFAKGPFVEVNCSTLPRGLEEAELFGYEKGAFTGAHRSKRGLFEAAGGGTIFLNEIGELVLEAQVKLLGVIERKCLRRVGGLRDIAVDVRVIAASNRDLKDKAQFREDLYHRLNHLTVELPPLHERKDDILDLAGLFLRRSCAKYNVEKRFSDEAKSALLNYHWPGNVRELKQLVERAAIMSGDSIVSVDDLSLPQKRKTAIAIDEKADIKINFPSDGIDLESIEKEVIVKALRFCAGNVSDAARKLGIGREALRYRIKKYSIHKLTDIIG